jgi:NAD(P)-dependent dehydrogenase (short-subunit alcohol dehydrogenase family)
MGRLQDKSVIVTGAARGIGRAIAELFAGEGARVMLTDIDEDEVDSTAEVIRSQGSVADSFVQDVSDESTWEQVVATVVERFGGIDVLVNNAGIGKPCPIEQTSLDQWRQTMAVNLEGTFLGIKHVLPRMRDGGGGSIINLSSVGGIVGSPGMGAYCTSKGGVRLLTKSVALECAMSGCKVRVNSIHPGFIDTGSAQEVAEQVMGLPPDEAIKRLTSMVPMARPGDPQEIAYGALYLASDESSYVTGAELVIDGGMSAV